MPVILETTQIHAMAKETEICPTLTSSMGTGGGYVPMIAEEMQRVTGTLSGGAHPGSYNGQDAYNDMLVVEDESMVYRQRTTSPTTSTRTPTLVGERTDMDEEKRYAVRRLTPTECERLQGYPDGWTDIGDWVDSKGKVRQTTDSARYKALGNSICLPPWKWVLKRISATYERDATLGSLFDGIGGFPLIWSQLNDPDSVLWASEIEEFCIAVTERRFNNGNT